MERRFKIMGNLREGMGKGRKLRKDGGSMAAGGSEEGISGEQS